MYFFYPENIWSASSHQLPISLHSSISQYHKRSSAVKLNVPAPHVYKRVFIEKWNAGQYDQMTILDQSK